MAAVSRLLKPKNEEVPHENQIKKILSIMIALAMALSMSAAMPLTASASNAVCEIGGLPYSSFSAAIESALLKPPGSVTTIDMLANTTTSTSSIIITGNRTIIINLNNKIVDVNNYLHASGGSKFLISGSGELNCNNVTSFGQVVADGSGSKIVVTNIKCNNEPFDPTVLADNQGEITILGNANMSSRATTGGKITVHGNLAVHNLSVYDAGSSVTVYGNVTRTSSELLSVPVVSASDGGSISIWGTITYPPKVDYITVAGQKKGPDDYVPSSANDEFLIYTAGTGSNKSYVYVRNPIKRYVCMIPETGAGYPSFSEAINAFKSGQKIRLLDNITLNGDELSLGENLTIDLNNKELNVTDFYYGLYVVNCQLNITTGGWYGRFNLSGNEGALAVIKGKATVTNATALGYDPAVYADNSEVTILKNVMKVEQEEYAVKAMNGSKVTVEGAIITPPGGKYIMVGSTGKMPSEGKVSTVKPGYIEYTDHLLNPNAATANTVWVKGATVPSGTGGKPGDLNNDGKVDATDLSMLISVFGK